MVPKLPILCDAVFQVSSGWGDFISSSPDRLAGANWLDYLLAFAAVGAFFSAAFSAWAAFRIPKSIHDDRVDLDQSELTRKASNYRALVHVELEHLGSAFSTLSAILIVEANLNDVRDLDEADDDQLITFRGATREFLQQTSERMRNLPIQFDSWPLYLKSDEVEAIAKAMTRIRLTELTLAMSRVLEEPELSIGNLKNLKDSFSEVGNDCKDACAVLKPPDTGNQGET